MSEPSSQASGRVDLATLSSGLHVLGVAPAWSAVERALDRLETARSMDGGFDDLEVQEDLQTVHEFHELLERSAETLALALLCGAVLGQASSAESFGERLLAGLRAISRSYGFDRLDEADRQSYLKELRRKLKDEGLVPPGAYGIPQVVKALDLSGWEVWCQQLRRLVEQAPVADRLRTELPTYRDLAWSLWNDRLAVQPHVEKVSWPKMEPVVADLVCAAAGVSPASRLDLDLGRMGLIAWSEVVHGALTINPATDLQGCPTWLALPALYHLGFPPKLSDDLEDLVVASLLSKPFQERGEDPLHWLSNWPMLRKRGAGNDYLGLLIVRPEDGSMTSSWKVARRGGVLAFSQAQIQSLNERHGRSKWPSWFEIDLLIIEVTGAETAYSAKKHRELCLPEFTRQILITRESSTRDAGGLPVIYNPRNVNDLVDRASWYLHRDVT